MRNYCVYFDGLYVMLPMTDCCSSTCNIYNIMCCVYIYYWYCRHNTSEEPLHANYECLPITIIHNDSVSFMTILCSWQYIFMRFTFHIFQKWVHQDHIYMTFSVMIVGGASQGRASSTGTPELVMKAQAQWAAVGAPTPSLPQRHTV